MDQKNVIGLMSGSSLDGVDLCSTVFFKENSNWKYEHCIAETIPYTSEWKEKLKLVDQLNAEDFCNTNVHYGRYLGSLVKAFIDKNQLSPDLIASHGHTIFHQPERHFTTQIGDGASIYALTGIKTVTDFRNVDVALGGQGAPLVPVGERDLFGDYGMFLNLGGIANISVFNAIGRILAYDITPCNMALNMLCEKYFDVDYDKDGDLASKGNLNLGLLKELNHLTYFNQVPPKSLGKEFVSREYLPIIENFDIAPEDKLFTVIEQVSNIIGFEINNNSEGCRKKNVLATGGGVYNKLLLDKIREKSEVEITVPTPMVVEFKEALIFAYLGLLRVVGCENSLSSVTNARQNSIGGALWG